VAHLIQKYPRLLPAMLVGGLLTLLSAWLLATDSALVRKSYDWSQLYFSTASLSNSPVAIVYLDLDSYLREKQNPSQAWDRALHAQLLRRLTGAGAKTVVFDIIFDGLDGPGPDAGADREFVDAIRANDRVVLAGEITRGSRSTTTAAGFQSLNLTLPDKPFLQAAAACGVANASMDDDFIVRRQLAGFAGFDQPSLSYAAAHMLGLSATNFTGVRWLRYYGKPLTIPHVSYSTALRRDEVSDDFFRDKIIFIGARPLTGSILERKDEFRSPLTTWGDRDLFMPAVEVHATQLLNLIRGDSLVRRPGRTELLLLAFSAFISAWVLFLVRPLPAAGIALLLEAGVVVMVAMSLDRANLWFPWLVVSVVQIPGALAGSALFQSLEWYKQKKRFEELRRADELKIREQAALIEKAQDAIWVEDLDGKIIYTNPSAEKLYGWSLAELQAGEAAKRIFFMNEARSAEARQAAKMNGEWLGEFDQTTRSGKKVTVASRCTLIRDGSGEPKSLLFINTDVTEKKKLEKEFYRAQRIESIGVIAGGIAHDLNNSLSPVLMGLQLLRRQQADDETQRMLSVMEGNTHRAADMVKQVLLFSRGRDGEKVALFPGALLREMERIVRHTFPKSINVATLAPADLWSVMGDATQLHQILLNLCVNARDAMPDGGQLTLAADNVELTADEATQIPNATPGRFVMLLVSDTGCGIRAEILPQIFEPFFTTKPVGQGTGLGLSTTARIVIQHGGFVNVKSELNRGTSFEIYVPALAAASPEKQSVSAHALPMGNGELILVVDDEQSVREMMSLGLTAQGYRVISTANGAEGIALLQQHSAEVKLVFLDDDMPVMSGRAALPRLRACSPAVPIVLMSGEAAAGSVGGNIQSLAKPFQLDELLKIPARFIS
jgi:PAS domain S-box-containing protein